VVIVAAQSSQSLGGQLEKACVARQAKELFGKA